MPPLTSLRLEKLLARNHAPTTTPQRSQEASGAHCDTLESEIAGRQIKPVPRQQIGETTKVPAASGPEKSQPIEGVAVALASKATKKQKVSSGAVVATKKVVQEEKRRKVPPKKTNNIGPIQQDAKGHFIVTPGNIIVSPDNREYKICSQIGEGTFGRVVKCVDLRSSGDEGRLVALKISPTQPDFLKANKKEYRVLKWLMRADPENRHGCIHPKDCFDLEQHSCIVFPLFGLSLFAFMKENEFRPFPRDHVWDFACQLLDSLQFIHGLGVIHTDLKPENVLLVYDESREFTRTTRIGPQERQKLLWRTRIQLIDFGCAVVKNDKHDKVVSSLHYRAPEIILEMGWSFSCDIFSLGCILVELYTGYLLLPSKDPLQHLAMMEAAMGRLPEQFRCAARLSKPGFFKENNEVDYPRKETTPEAARDAMELEAMSELIPLKDATSRAFLRLVEQMLRYEPEYRIKASEARQTSYILSNPPPESLRYREKWTVVP